MVVGSGGTRGKEEKYLQGLVVNILKDRICSDDVGIDGKIIIKCIVLMINEMHNSYNQFLFHSFLSVLHVWNESSRSSSGTQRNILYCTVQYIMPCS